MKKVKIPDSLLNIPEEIIVIWGEESWHRSWPLQHLEEDNQSNLNKSKPS